MKAKVLFAVGLTVSFASLGEDTSFTNRTATLTNLEGRVYRNVQLVRGDSDGIVYLLSEGAGGGRICYTNLAPEVLQSLGIPTNRIATARVRVRKKAVVDPAEWRRAQEEAAKSAASQKLSLALLTLHPEKVYGQVERTTDDGLLVWTNPGFPQRLYAMLSDYAFKQFDGDWISTNAYSIGSYQDTLGRTIRHYTCDRVRAAKYLLQSTAAAGSNR